MDMVGGDPFKDKSILHLTGSFAGSAVVETRTGDQGTRNQFLADVTPYSSGNDHDDYDIHHRRTFALFARLARHLHPH
jgi:hypothetical protein